MTSLSTQPQLVTTAASDLAEIRLTIGAAKAAAAGPTTGVVAAATDEVSAATAQLFSTYAERYQTVLARASSFHEEFIATLASAGNAYAAAESANANAISGVPTPTSLVMSPLRGTTVGLIIGGTAQPIPPRYYVNTSLNYLNQNFDVLSANAHALNTPEGFYPLTGVKTLTLDQSVSQGVQILDNAIKQQLDTNPRGSVAVLGVSQSAVISSLEMENLANPLLNPIPPTANQLGFTLLGDEMNPNGGIFARFPGFPAGQPLQLSSLGYTFYGATPPDTIYPTHIYTLEYDGFADFPQYPINFLADLNAIAGMYYVHGIYPSLNPSALPPGYAIQQLPTSPGYTGVTTYDMITYANLPLLDPVRSIPVIGNPLADLLQPDLTTIVNLGYGNPDYGWSQGPADVQTYFGLFPHVSQQLIVQDLVVGAHQGVTALVSDIHAEASGASVSSVSHSLTSAVAEGLSPNSIIEEIQSATTNIANGISNTAANAYAVLLPTADIANVLITEIPAYDANLFLSGIQQALNGDVLGGLQYALVAPIAADMALVPVLAGFELIVVLNGVESITGGLG
jgi:PE-PPE domain/PE family